MWELTTFSELWSKLTRTEFGSYASDIPHEALSALVLGLTDKSRKADVALAAQAASKAGLEQVTANLYVLDQGEVELPAGEADEPAEGAAESEDKTTRAMRLGRLAREALDAGQATTYRAAGAPLGLTKEQVHKYIKLVALPEDVC